MLVHARFVSNEVYYTYIRTCLFNAADPSSITTGKKIKKCVWRVRFIGLHTRASISINFVEHASAIIESRLCCRFYMSYTHDSCLYIMHTVRRSRYYFMGEVQRHRQVIHQTMKSDTSNGGDGFADKLIRGAAQYNISFRSYPDSKRKSFKSFQLVEENLAKCWSKRMRVRCRFAHTKSLGRIIGRRGGVPCREESKFWEPIWKNHFRLAKWTASFVRHVHSIVIFPSQILESFY